MKKKNILYNVISKRALATVLNVQYKTLTYVLYRRGVDSFYNEFEIQKKTGGTRIINAPQGELKTLQKNLAKILEKSINNSSNISHGFIKNKSIYTNAATHRNKCFVLNMDLQNFFDSFHFGRVRGFFKKNRNFNCTNEIATMIAQIVCYKGKLPQGAPSSPVITNLICGSLDYRISKLSKKYKLDYTRYADDITFSTNNRHFICEYENFLNEITEIIEKSGFKINDKKTRLTYSHKRQTVTGVVVNKKLSVPREYYKQTRAMAFNFYKNRIAYLDESNKTLNQIEGRFSYINSFDKLNNILELDKNNKKKNLKDLNNREKDYARFIFYKYFYMNSKPLIITEGKTDILYIKAALKNLVGSYKDLYNGEFKINFLRRSKRFAFLLKISMDGADTIKNFYKNYYTKPVIKDLSFDYFLDFGYYPDCPIIILLDNEPDGKHPLGKFVSSDKSSELLEQLRLNGFIRLNKVHNVYLSVVPKNPDKKLDRYEIEDLFDEELLHMELNGKKFNREGLKGYYTKDDLSKYVYSHYEEINFNNFNAMFENFRNIIADYQKWYLANINN